MIAAPPGMMVTATGYGRSASWLVTVRPAMMPTAEPKTASLSQCRFAGRREMATYDEKMYAGTEYFQLRCRSSAVAKANVSAAWPDGNELLPLPSGRSRARDRVVAPRGSEAALAPGRARVPGLCRGPGLGPF